MDLKAFHDLDIVVICGLPASGKSTFAEKYFKNEERLRINRKEIRKFIYEMTHFNTPWNESLFNEKDEQLVWHVERKMFEHLLHQNKKILIDNTSITRDSRKKYTEIAQTNKKTIGAIFVNITIEDCIKNNDKKGEQKVPVNVITKLYSQIEPISKSEGFNLLGEYRSSS